MGVFRTRTLQLVLAPNEDCLMLRWVMIACGMLGALGCWNSAFGDDTFLRGCDISMLPFLESHGAVYRLHGVREDAIRIMRDSGCNVFRVRLFVQPDPHERYGAIQDLAYVRALARRIKASGAMFLLDFHYSDTWADPAKQYTPAAWKGQDFAALKRTIHDYTASVIAALKSDGDTPDLVQLGNEETAGILWPVGQISNVKDDAQWQRFAGLVNSAASAIREAQTPAHKIRIIIHIHGGGRAGLPKWFFGEFNRYAVDYDIMGLSFYPAWGDSLDNLKQSLKDIVPKYGKDVLLAETSYPWKELPDIHEKAMTWPQTPQGQKTFLEDTARVLNDVPDHHGLGFVWWYPEAVPVAGMAIWRSGDEALFNSSGEALPALLEYGQLANIH